MNVEITSTANPRVRTVRALHDAAERRRQGEFLIEGVRLVEAALDAGLIPRTVLVAPPLLDRTPRGRVLSNRLGDRATTVAQRVLGYAADTLHPQGVVATLPLPAPLSSLPDGLALVLDDVADPGNAGTILRSADASGVVGAVIAVGGVDLYAPKVVRAGMGAHFRLVLLEATWDEVPRLLAQRVLTIADAAASQPYWAVDWRSSGGLIVGGEARGASDRARALAGAATAIPMRPGAESLNVAVAASIILFEAARQRTSPADRGGPTTE